MSKIHTQNTISMYLGHREGGCVDIAEVRLEGYTLVENKDLARLMHTHAVLEPDPIPQHILQVLRIAHKAVSGPRGVRPKSKKAAEAFDAIRDLLSTLPVTPG